MSERVQCAECERLYDSEEHPFCPRCGATAKTNPTMAARSIANRSDPRRRRVQVAGILMVSTGTLVLLMGVFMLASAGSVWDFASNLQNDQPDAAASLIPPEGTNVSFQVLNAGLAQEGVNVSIASVDGTFMAYAITNATGMVQFDAVQHLVVAVTVPTADGPWTTEFIAVNLNSEAGAPLNVELETSDRTLGGTPVMDQSMVETTTRVMGGGAMLLGITPVMGGIAALRLKNQQLALFGSIMGAVPWLFLFVASMNLAVLLIMALFVMAVVFVRQGRDLFTT